MGKHSATGSGLVLLMVLAILATPTVAYAAPRCFGEAATIVGTSGRDRLVGTNGRDVIVGLGGRDRLLGRGGKDLLCGNNGGDLLIGGDGRDRLDGGRRADGLKPGAGNDIIDGGKSLFDDLRYPDAPGAIEASLITGTATGHGKDTFENVEQLVGGPFDDVLEGDDGPINFLIGLAGNDVLTGNGGDNLFGPGAGDDQLIGGDAFDFMVNDIPNLFIPPLEPLAGPMTVDLTTGTATGNGTDTLVAIDGVSGSLGDDVMIGNGSDNEFTRLIDGSDTVDAGGGNDVVDGGDGADDLDGGPGIDLLGNLDATAGMTVDLSVPSTSHGDTVAGFENVWGTTFDDVLTGDDGPNEILGIDGNDDIVGLDADDVLIGDGFGATDVGDDSADGGNGFDACEAESEANCETDPPPPTSYSPVRSAIAMKMP
jgi:Ca2+-binding RTX toxin-like protein